MSGFGTYILSLLAAAVLTVLLEAPVCALLLGRKGSRGYVLRLSCLVNLITNILINWVGIPLLSRTVLWRGGNGLLCLALLEFALAYAGEALLYLRLIRGLSPGKSVTASLVANTLSLGLGYILYAWLEL